MKLRRAGLLCSALALCALAAFEAFAVCSICGKANCSYDTGSGSFDSGGVKPPDSLGQLQQQAMTDFLAKNPEVARQAQDALNRGADPGQVQGFLARQPGFQSALADKVVADPEMSRFRAEALERKAEQLAAQHARLLSAERTPEQRARDVQRAAQNVDGLSSSQREIIVKSAGLGQLMVAVAGASLGRSSPNEAGAFTGANVQWSNTAKSEAVTIRFFVENTAVAASKQAEAVDRLDSVKIATPLPEDRARVMTSPNAAPALRRTIVEQAAIATEASTQARERTRIAIVVPPVPKPDEKPAKTESLLEKWGKQAVQQMGSHTNWVTNIYPQDKKPDGRK